MNDPFHSEFRRWMVGLLERGLAPAALQVECEEAFPNGVHELFAKEGFYTLAMPRDYGGKGAGAGELALTIEAIARHSPSAALLVFPTNAVLRILEQVRTGEQKERFFGEFAEGGKCLAFCLSEPDHGSDAGGLPPGPKEKAPITWQTAEKPLSPWDPTRPTT